MVYIERSIIFACIKLMQRVSTKEEKVFDKYLIEEVLEKHDIHPKDRIKDKILELSKDIEHFIFIEHGIFNPNHADSIYSFSTGMLKLLSRYDLE